MIRRIAQFKPAVFVLTSVVMLMIAFQVISLSHITEVSSFASYGFGVLLPIARASGTYGQCAYGASIYGSCTIGSIAGGISLWTEILFIVGSILAIIASIMLIMWAVRRRRRRHQAGF